MEVALCTLADHANVTREGKLNVIGIFDRITVKKLPARHPAMCLVVRFRTRFQDSESTSAIRATLEGPDGGKIVDVNGEVSVGTMRPGQIGHQNVIFNLANTPFQSSGTYTARVYIDGEPQMEVPLEVVMGGGRREVSGG